MKWMLVIAVIIMTLGAPGLAFAQQAPTDFGELISSVYSTAQTFIVICVFVLLVYAGFNILFHPDDEGKVAEAKTIAWNCLIGVVLLYSSVMILRVIAGDQYVANPTSVFPAPGAKLPQQ